MKKRIFSLFIVLSMVLTAISAISLPVYANSNISISEIETLVINYFSNTSGLDGKFVIFDSETIKKNEDYIFIVRYQGGSAANILHAMATVKIETGEMFINDNYVCNLWNVSNTKNDKYDTILKGDFSLCAGKYINQSGGEIILLDNGLDEWSNENGDFNYKATDVTKMADGSYSWGIIPYKNGNAYGGYGIILYPEGIDVIAYDGSVIQTDTSKIRLWSGNGSVSESKYIYYRQDDVVDEIKVVLNGEEIKFDQPPINTPEGRLLVPIRKIAESMDKIVLYSEETKTAFIDNSDNALIIPLFEKTMYLANENGFNSWGKVELDVPAIETNGRTLVPVRAFCESLGATVIWEDKTKTAFIKYDDSIVSERMNDMLFDSINLVWYMERLDALWSTEEFPFDDYSVVIDDFYINRPYGVDAINMGLSDPFAGIQDLISMTNGSDNATNIILQSMQEILSEVPSGTDLNFDAGIVKALKEMVASGVDIYSEVGGLGYKLRSYSDAFVFLDDALLDYSNNYHSTVSGIFDLSVFTLEELAYLLTEYQTNVEYLDIFENKLKEAGYSDETIEKSVSLLRTQYTNKFIGVMLDLRSACVEASVGAVLNAGLTIAGQSTWGVGVGMLVWKGIFGITGINKQGEALKTFYGLYCIDNRLNSTFNDVISVHESLTSSELLELRRLIELLKAEKTTAYKAMKNITWDKDSKNEADKQIEELQKFTYRIFK